MSARRSHWVLMIVGAALGAFFGAWIAFVTMLDGGPTFNPVQCSVSHSHSPISGVTGAKLEVDLFGQLLYTRAAGLPEDFDTETTVLQLATPASVVLVATWCGLWVGSLIGRSVRRLA